MTYQPIVVGSGLPGWRFLQATADQQRAAHGASTVQQREMDHFRARIGDVSSAEELVSDYRLLSVALGAFGLEAEIGSKYLVRTALAEGTRDRDALANRLTDSRFREMSRAFGFGDADVPNTKMPGFADRILDRFAERSFEVAVGEVDDTMRLALNAKRELRTLGEGEGSDRTKWFTLMGNPPLRKVMETVLGLDPSFGSLPIDRQLDEFQDRAEGVFGTSDLRRLVEPETLDRLLDRFTAMADVASGPPTSPALVLLRGF